MHEVKLNKFVAASEAKPGWTVINMATGPIPRYDVTDKETELGFCYSAEIVSTDGAESHTVLLAFMTKGGLPQYEICCSDAFLEHGRLDPDMVKSRSTEALQRAACDDSALTLLTERAGTYSVSAVCSFYKDYRRSNGDVICEHTQVFLAHLRDNIPSFREDLKNGLENFILEANSPKERISGGYTFEELAFKVPVLIEGDRGAGKTVTAREFSRKNGYHRVELGGNQGTEAIDFLGHLVEVAHPSNGSKTIVWKDGPLSEAFRSAKAGVKTVLILDEILRIRMRELSILLTPLSPDEGYYRLRTGRVVDIVDGVAREEVLECLIENLCIVATTNVGAQYTVDSWDPAILERFVVLRKDSTYDSLKKILTMAATLKGFSKKSVEQSLTFWGKANDAIGRGMLPEGPTTRTLVRAFELATSEDLVKKGLTTQTLLWAGRNSRGMVVPEHTALVEALLDAAFKTE